MSILAAVAAFGAGVLLVLGLALIGRRRTATRYDPAGTRFELSDVDHAPDDLEPQTPCAGVLVRRLPGRDRGDYWLARLATPLRWSDEGVNRSVDHLVLAARFTGQSLDEPFTILVVGVAYVVDPTLLADASLSFDKTRYVAIGTIRRL